MRILPTLLIIMGLALALRFYSIAVDGKAAYEQWLIADSIAQSPAMAEEPESDSEEESDTDSESEEENEDEATEDDNKETTEDADTPKTNPALDSLNTNRGDADGKAFSQIEIDLLQSLSKRREELDAREQSLKLRESVLKATEMRIDEKINEIRELKVTVEELLAKYNEEERKKIMSLVKIYQNMKPKDAARIFEDLDMDVLLPVVDKISERKLAPILAKMNPEKAREVTEELAEQNQLPDIESMDLPE